jgi:hypothetical protein
MAGTTESLAEAMARLEKCGFTHRLRAAEAQLRDLETGSLYDPERLRIAEAVRFEGDTDPDEQAVLFALCTPSGSPLGIYAVAYGLNMPREDVRIVRRLATGA